MNEDKTMSELLKECHNCIESENKPFSIATGFDGNTYCPHCKKYANYDALRGDMTSGEFMGAVQGAMRAESKYGDEKILPFDEEELIMEDNSWKEV